MAHKNNPFKAKEPYTPTIYVKLLVHGVGPYQKQFASRRYVLYHNGVPTQTDIMLVQVAPSHIRKCTRVPRP